MFQESIFTLAKPAHLDGRFLSELYTNGNGVQNEEDKQSVGEEEEELKEHGGGEEEEEKVQGGAEEEEEEVQGGAEEGGKGTLPPPPSFALTQTDREYYNIIRWGITLFQKVVEILK